MTPCFSRRSLIRSLVGGSLLLPGIVSELLADQAKAEVDPLAPKAPHFRPRAKRVIDLAYDEARQLNNNYIGTEHLLLGLIREGDGLAGKVLAKLGVDLERTREAVVALQNAAADSEQPARRSVAPIERAWASS